MSQRLHIEITGTVQGVGFRPFCYQQATKLSLSGWVLNHSSGVHLQIQGNKLKTFLDILQSNPPPSAQIKKISHYQIPFEKNESKFIICASENSKTKGNLPPDSGLCKNCLQDLFDPNSRYYHYPFLNCSHCGPRYSMSHGLPYDRTQTSMVDFKHCADCQKEYGDSNNRRFHAQATACSACGPQLNISPKEILSRLQEGQILAIKGVGGFHLVCDANNNTSIKKLRQHKQRQAKPFAIMGANIESLNQWVELNRSEIKLLTGPERPIVLARKKTNTLSPLLAPDLKWLGVILPYTPLHYLIFNEAANTENDNSWLKEAQPLALVITSANLKGEPLIIDNQEAPNQLADIADFVVSHNQTIINRIDDSVMRINKNGPYFIRRARGFIPCPIKLAKELPTTLALGGHLKNTICIIRGDEAFISHHIGDLDNRKTIRFFEQTIHQQLKLLGVTPERIAHDLHPDFYSRRLAESFGLPCIEVQHHHVHLAAVVAEHQIKTPAIGIALDGFGLGENQQSWGGELMLIDGENYQRLGHLKPLKQPGGDQAAHEPWRMAAAVLHQLDRGDEITQYFKSHQAADNIGQLLKKNIHSPYTSSAGRLFDAAAALLNIQHINQYEGHAAMMLESLVTKTTVMHGAWNIQDGILDLLPLLEKLIDCDAREGANLFHGTLIAALSDWIEQAARQNNIETVLLSGGCFLNQVLNEGVMTELKQRGLNPKHPQQVPANDGGLSLGQAWIAALTPLPAL